ncbi:LuxR C-terminal-related transcriptional regulator [Oceanihabitans sp. 1_MG-2023]|uniref:response regulator transcription factor n=1 Tax=Flavobacteriaceae TaxID=49546 RepID=UPI0026E3AA13|nr:LuxR C-terminal-related transcriptional regulator [Oceanihabitans sp. 1_MG-2023]MDO6621477.1 LuxR C-terminal-related transcriptional regulator [Oceanihabitans sp. 1_MG-2023]
MNFKIYLYILFCIFPCLIIAKNIDPIALENEISKLNDQQKYEVSFLKLDKIIDDPSSDSFDRAHAYIQMSYTFKRVYNHVMTVHMLKLAEQEALKSTHKNELEAKILAERMFFYFEIKDFENVTLILDKFNSDKVSYLSRETLAHYHSILAAVAVWDEDYKKAEENYNIAASILEQVNPKHLPSVYRATLAMHSLVGDSIKVIQAFEKGLYYAKKYEVPLYDLIMHESLTKHYKKKGDYENALKMEELVNIKRKEYDAANSNDKLVSLRNKIKKEREELALKAENNRIYYWSIISVIITVLVITLLVLLGVYKQKNKLISNENKYIRLEVERLSKEIDTNNNKGIIEIENLTERQLEVVKLVKQGKTNKEIGNELFISENTVKYHLKAIYEILGVPNRIMLRQNYKL